MEEGPWEHGPGHREDPQRAVVEEESLDTRLRSLDFILEASESP